MPDVAAHAFTDPDEFYSAIRNWVDGFVTERGDYRAEFTHVDFSRLWISRGEESLARVVTVTPRVERTTILFGTDQDQPAMRVAGIGSGT